jgi:hypothetical protein
MEGTCAPARNTADNANAEIADNADDDDSSPDMGTFADPDPLDTFHFEYKLSLPDNNEPDRTEPNPTRRSVLH